MQVDSAESKLKKAIASRDKAKGKAGYDGKKAALEAAIVSAQDEEGAAKDSTPSPQGRDQSRPTPTPSGPVAALAHPYPHPPRAHPPLPFRLARRPAVQAAGGQAVQEPEDQGGADGAQRRPPDAL